MSTDKHHDHKERPIMVRTEDYAGEDRRKWHIDRTVNIGHLLTTVAMLASLLVVLSKFDTRLTLVELHIANQSETNRRHEATDHELKQAIKESFDRLELKLDKVLEQRRSP